MAQDDATALQWLRENPNDKEAAGVRAKLRSKGYTVEDPPGTDPGVGQAEAFEQGAIFDPIKAIGQMLPTSVSGAIAGAMPDWLKNYMAESASGAAEHPAFRTAGNIAPWLLVPGVGEGAGAAALVGAGSGLLQPVDDPNKPGFWRQKGEQAGLGAVLGGGAGKLASSVAAQKAAKAATEAATALKEGAPERVTRAMYDRIAAEVRDPSIVPKDITPQTAAQVQNKVGAKLTAIYKKMNFTPDTAWTKGALNIRDTIANQLVNPEMRERWTRTFGRDAIGPAFSSNAPITGEKLGQLVSDLSAQGNEFGLAAQQGGPHADQWRIMADGLRQIRASVEAQIDAANPALGAERRAANRAYTLTDVMVRGTSAKKGGIAPPADLIGAWQSKLGKKQYGADPRFGTSKAMLEKERQIHTTPVPTPPGAQKPSALGNLARQVIHAPAMILGYKLGSLFGHPLIGGMIGREASEAAMKGGVPVAAAAGKRPGVVGATAGQVAPSADDLLTGLFGGP